MPSRAVEQADQLARLRQMGCELAQGFHFSPALPPAELEALLRPAGTGRWTSLLRRATEPGTASS